MNRTWSAVGPASIARPDDELPPFPLELPAAPLLDAPDESAAPLLDAPDESAAPLLDQPLEGTGPDEPVGEVPEGRQAPPVAANPMEIAMAEKRSFSIEPSVVPATWPDHEVECRILRDFGPRCRLRVTNRRGHNELAMRIAELGARGASAGGT